MSFDIGTAVFFVGVVVGMVGGYWANGPWRELRRKG